MGQNGRCAAHHKNKEVYASLPPPSGDAGQTSAHDEGNFSRYLTVTPFPLPLTVSLTAVVIALVVSGYFFLEDFISTNTPGSRHIHFDVLAGLSIAAILLALVTAQYIYMQRAHRRAYEYNAAHLGSEKSNAEEIIEIAADIIISIGPDLNIKSFNHAAELAFGYPKAEAIGRPLDILLPEAIAEGHDQYIAVFAEDTVNQKWMGDRASVQARRKDGSLFRAEASISKYKVQGGFVFTILMRDVTEKLIAENVLLEKERTMAIAWGNLTEAINTLSEGFAYFDADDRLILCNDVYSDAYFNDQEGVGFSSGTKFEDILRSGLKHGAFLDAIGCEDEWFEKRMEMHRSSTESYAQQLSDGRWFLVNERRTSDGGYVGTRTDITSLKVKEAEHKQAEMDITAHRDHLEVLVDERTKEVQEQAARLEEALQVERKYSAMQQEFVSLVSHEFRTPLTIIDGMAQRMLRRKENIEPDEVEERVSKIRASVDRMTALIDKTLSASMIDSAGVKVARERCAIRNLINEICARHNDMSRTHAVKVDIESVPREIICDPRLFDQIVSNLLSNAEKYSPGCSEIHLKGWTEDHNLVVCVKDNGLGIPLDDMPKLFERFFRAKTSAGIQGTGIGLSVVKHFTEIQGGTVAVDSIEGAGSTFTINIPLLGGMPNVSEVGGGIRESGYDQNSLY